MVDVVLIYPPYERWGEGAHLGVTFTPLGLPYIAAVLERNGYSVQVIDADMDGYSIGDLVDLLHRVKPQVVGVNVSSPALPSAYALVRQIKDSGLKVHVVLGGHHVTADPSIVELIGADYGVRGDGEYSFLELCDYLVKGVGGLDAILGLVYKRNDELVSKPPALVEGLDSLPFPARHLLANFGGYDYKLVLSSRGCPFKCIYCSVAGTKYRCRSPEGVVDELEHLVDDCKVKSIDFSDDVFTLDGGHVLQICDLIRERGIKLRWACQTRANLVDRELLEAVYSAGCYVVTFGMEAGSQDTRYLIGKKVSDDDFRKAIQLCNEVGLQTRVSAMFGHPGETVEDMQKTLSFMEELNPDYVVYSVTRILPGTQLFEMALREGVITEDIWHRYMWVEVDQVRYSPLGLTAEELTTLNAEAVNHFYLRRDYMSKKLKSIKSLSDLSECSRLVGNYLLRRLNRSS